MWWRVVNYAPPSCLALIEAQIVSTFSLVVGKSCPRVLLDQTNSPLTTTSKLPVTPGSLISRTEIWPSNAFSKSFLSWWDFGPYPHPPQYRIWMSILATVVVGERPRCLALIVAQIISTRSLVVGKPCPRVLDQTNSPLTTTSKLPVTPGSLISLTKILFSKASSNSLFSRWDFRAYPHPPQYWIWMSSLGIVVVGVRPRRLALIVAMIISTRSLVTGKPCPRFLDQTNSPPTTTSKLPVTPGSLISRTVIWPSKAFSNSLFSRRDFLPYPHPPQY